MFGRRRQLSGVGRVAVVVSLTVLGGLSLLSVVAYATLRQQLVSTRDRALLAEVQAYSAAIAPASTEDTRGLVAASRAYLGGREPGGGFQPVLTIRFADGRVLSNSDVRLEEAAGNAILLDPSAARRGFAYVTATGVRYRAATALVSGADGTVVAVFQAAEPSGQVDTVLSSLGVTLAATAGLISLAAAGLSILAARSALAPLREMATSAGRITQSSLAERIAYDGPDDELGVLASTLDAMLDRIEAAFASQRRFVADASHEMRTPLTIVRGNLHLLRQEWSSAEEKAEALRIIDEETSRMERLVEDLLALARSHGEVRRPFQPLEMCSLLTEVGVKGRALGERRIEVRCPSDLWTYGDPDLLEQALLNVVRNAVEHTTAGGSIELACTGDAHTLEVRISDDGHGLIEADLPRIFDRFFRSGGTPRSEDSGGSGLGLAIAQALLEQHSGSISAGNRESGGAEFAIRLPAIDAPGASETPE